MTTTAFITATPLSSRTSRPQFSTTCPRPQVGALPARTARSARSHVTMISPELARSAIAVYGVAIAGGGIAAFLNTGSKPSVISGVAAGIVLAAAYLKDSVPVALGTALALCVVFGIRFLKTKKFMPSGMLLAASLVAAAVFAASIYA